jgi:tetratricopeptide (TPR) repeat protein
MSLFGRRRARFRVAARAARILAIVAAAVGTSAAWQGQSAAPPASPSSSTSPAPTSPDVIYDHYRSTIVVEADGQVTRDTVVRLRTVTTDGVAEAGTLRLPFERDMATLEVHYVRVRKADGTVVETPVATAIDVPSDITRAAPAYTDLYERHINVRGLAVGDVVEYAMRSLSRPLLAGHFTLGEESFVGEAVVDAEITLSVPTASRFIVKTSSGQRDVAREGDRTVYRWRVSHPHAWTPDEIDDLVAERRTRGPAVQVTSFNSWQEVGEAVRELWRERAAVTPAIREKAQALVAGSNTDAERIAAIYEFVSREVRYVAVSFGVGRLQPHPATEVLRNGFGDCKDKHVLIEALLRAVGIESSPVLVAPMQFVDVTVPSPTQFSHVITRVDSSGGAVWIDGTVAPAPVGYLPFTERDRDGLLVPASGVAALVRTPAEGSRPTTSSTILAGAIDASGTLEMRFETTLTGDLDFTMRTALRQLTEAQRREVLGIAYTQTYGGKLIDIQLPNVEDVSGPVVVSGRVSTPNYSGWVDGRIRPPLPPVEMPELPTGRAVRYPLELGPTIRASVVSRLELPEGYVADIDGKPSFERSISNAVVRYRLSMAIDNRTLVVEVASEALTTQLSPAQIEDFRAYRTQATSATPWVQLRDAWPWTSVSVPRFQNPQGQNAQATLLVAQAQRSTSRGVAEGLLRKAVAIEPTHPTAWSLLGDTVTHTHRDGGDGVSLMRHQIDVAPSADAYKRIGTSAMSHERWGAAAAAFREGIGKYPDDRDMPALLGEVLINDGLGAEAVPVLEAEAARRPRSSRLQLALGRAYLQAGKSDEGVAALHAAVAREAGPNIWSMAAYELAAARRDLPRARQYAENAVARTLTENEANELSKLGNGAATGAQRLAFYYEALGRVLLAEGSLDRGILYCRAAWDLKWLGAQCLVDAAQAQNNPTDVERYRAFLSHPGPPPYMPAGAWRSRLPLKAPYPTLRPGDGPTILEVPSPPRLPMPPTARFEVITEPDGSIREARLLSSAREFEVIVGDLLGLVVGPTLPEGGKARLLRVASVWCLDSASGNMSTGPIPRSGSATSPAAQTSGPSVPATCSMRFE